LTATDNTKKKYGTYDFTHAVLHFLSTNWAELVVS